MSLRPRRALLGLVAAAASLAAAPSAALAAGEQITVTPSNLQAGGSTNITSTAHFAANETPKTIVISDAPGLLASLTANPSCVASQQLTAACQVGAATTSFTSPLGAGTIHGNVYLVPPQSSTDFAGLLTVAVVQGQSTSQYTGVSFRTTPTVGVNLTTTFPAPMAGVQITDVSTTLNATLNGQPFTRLPTSCSPATTTMSVTYASAATGSASGSFTPTGCASLPYSPTLAASITKDANDSGAAVVLTQTQAAGEAASKSIVFNLPKGLTPNVAADAGCLSGTPCKIGTASGTSPGVPNAALASGTVTLGGSITAPTIAVAFPAPFALTVTGTVSLATNSVTFGNVADVPLTSFTLNISGPNGQKAFNTDCAPANVTGAFTAQSGATKNVVAPIKFTGCPTVTATGSTSGLATGHPKLKFKISHGKGGANVSSVAIGVPRGLRFVRSAFKSHKTCTTIKSKKKCTTTTLISGLGITGGSVKSVALTRGKLVITLRKAARSATITLSGPLVSEAKSLQTKVKKHKAGKLTFTLKVTDTKHNSSTVTLKLAAH